MPSTLNEWLAHCERLHPREIDLTLQRTLKVRDQLGLRFEVPVFTVAGTNGKGSTCAMLEAILLQAGYRVGVYTSPHLVHFEERLRLNGEIVQAEALLPHFEAVEGARQAAGDIALTYFEFTTLAILHCMAAAPLDAVVLEVGLGGRLDAVNAIDTDCAIITSIDIDHTAFLGPDRESIGREKAGILRAGKPAIIGDPLPPASVIAQAEAIGADLWRFGQDFNYAGDRQQWGWSGRGRRHNALGYPALRGANQLINASGVLAALSAMRDRLPVPAQAVRNGLAMVELPGRFQVVPGQPALVLDVAHNPHAAAALMHNLDQMGYYPRTLAVFGAMADKDLAELVRPLLQLIDVWHCCDLPTARAASAAQLTRTIEQTWAAQVHKPAGRAEPQLYQHPDPVAALRQAIGDADPADRILVFGSFYTVGGVLQQGLPRLGAAHLGQG
ncbi:MAG: bifunctional tetrahydrofolate synthase/dihydrofolate synthase [Pseudomonadota bacterium]|jgi:dihydrofolate synthase/folylpolyglutamate synthase